MNIKDITQLKLIAGAIATDDRGSLSFVNNLFLDGLKRFYIIENHDLQFIRAWHGHEHEWKVFIPLVGSWIVACHSFEVSASKTVMERGEEGRYVLSEKNPSALVVPGGYMNGSMNLTEGAKLLVMSSSTLEESKMDDYRVPYFNSSMNWQSSFNIQPR